MMVVKHHPLKAPISKTRYKNMVSVIGDSSKEGMERRADIFKTFKHKGGEVPIVLASAAISSAYAGVSSVASQTPAELAENLAKSGKRSRQRFLLAMVETEELQF